MLVCDRGYEKMVNQKDEQIAMESMLGQRKLTTGDTHTIPYIETKRLRIGYSWVMRCMYVVGEIQRHFDGFGLEPQFAQHTRMGALSGGQKVLRAIARRTRVYVLLMYVCMCGGISGEGRVGRRSVESPAHCHSGRAHQLLGQRLSRSGCRTAIVWNALVKSSSWLYVGALATAIKDFKGGIFMISHNAEFYEALCPEKWILESGRVRLHTYIHYVGDLLTLLHTYIHAL
jgi:hypothetical protein